MLEFYFKTRRKSTNRASVNSLPENVYCLVNHRIAVQDSVQAVKDHYVQLLQPWADERHFALDAFGLTTTPKGMSRKLAYENTMGALTLAAQYELDSSPVSDAEDVRFGWLAGTLRGVFGDDIVVAPELLTGKLPLLPTPLQG